MTRVVCRQFGPRLGDLASNAELSTAAIRTAVAGGADVVVLPELITSGYMLDSPAASAREVAIGRDHPVLAAWAQAAAEGPELTRGLALAGAELLAIPTNWPLVERPPGERPPEVIAAMATARMNRVFVAACDRTATERGQEWTAGTHIIDAEGWVVAAADGDGAATAELDLSRARDKTLTDLADALGDRRPELYGAVTAPRPSASSA